MVKKRGLGRLQRAGKRALAARFAQQAFGLLLALAATGCDTEFTLQIAKRICAGLNGGTDVAFGYAVADTDIHGI